GGRVLGLFPPESDENVVWTHPALSSKASARSYFAQRGWQNPGGDRTWMAPEIDLFIGNPAHPIETYKVPHELDPGAWTLTLADGEARLTTAAQLRLQRTRRDVSVRIDKQISPAANPLADVDLQYAGYTLATKLVVQPQPDTPVRLGLWNLLQLPSPGVMLIPTCSPAQPQPVFGTIAAEELAIAPHLVCWRMGGDGVDAKFAFKAYSLTGRVGYLRRTETPEVWDLVIREFALDLNGDYIDALWKPPHETGWAFQACCIRAGAERFNELEYHAPAVSTIEGSNACLDVSRLWAYRGPARAIINAGTCLLGVDLAKVVNGYSERSPI
ncbi:MAG: hypothetical protein WCJ56_12825, partial [bacterium]